MFHAKTFLLLPYSISPNRRILESILSKFKVYWYLLIFTHHISVHNQLPRFTWMGAQKFVRKYSDNMCTWKTPSVRSILTDKSYTRYICHELNIFGLRSSTDLLSGKSGKSGCSFYSTSGAQRCTQRFARQLCSRFDREIPRKGKLVIVQISRSNLWSRFIKVHKYI